MSRQWIVAAALLAVLVTGCRNSRSGGECCEVMQEHYVHQYGVEVPKKDWSARGEYGQVITAQKNGVIVTKNYRGGQLHGQVTYTFPRSDAIEKTKVYQNGTLVKEVQHYPSGNPEVEILFHSPGAKTVTFWYEEGIPQRTEEFEDDILVQGQYFNKHNQIESRIDNGEGTRMNRDRFGNLISTDTYTKGQMTSRMVYHSNGSPKEIISYLNGKLHGVKKTFLPGGEPETIEHFANDQREGMSTYFVNGGKSVEIPYSKGKKHGIEKRYRNGVDVVEEISWREDKRHGSSILVVNGQKNVEWYIDGRQVSKSHYDRYIKTPNVAVK